MLRAALLAAAAAAPAAARRCVAQYPPGQHLIELGVRANASGPAAVQRQFLLTVPPEAAQGDGGVPLVIDFHGFTESPYYQDKLVGLTETVGRYGWLGVLPFGTAPRPRAGAAACCPDGYDAEACRRGDTLDQANSCSFNAGGCCGVAASDRAHDVTFAEAIVAWAAEHACADRAKVFAMGFSNGGMMSNRLACDAAHLVRAVGPVAGNIGTGGDFSACRPSRPVGWVSICGGVDFVCFLTIGSTARQWAEHNRCGSETHQTFTSETTTCQAYSGCADGSFVEWCNVQGLGHEWSGRPRPDGTSGSRPATDVDATAYIFDKFSLLAGGSVLRLPTTGAAPGAARQQPQASATLAAMQA